MELHVENSIEIASKKVAAFCAIAAPARFLNTLKTLGCCVILKQQKPDHMLFSRDELERLANRALDQGAECLVCTEKDAVKLPENLSLRLPIVPLEISLSPFFGKQHLEHIIQKVYP